MVDVFMAQQRDDQDWQKWQLTRRLARKCSWIVGILPRGVKAGFSRDVVLSCKCIRLAPEKSTHLDTGLRGESESDVPNDSSSDAEDMTRTQFHWRKGKNQVALQRSCGRQVNAIGGSSSAIARTWW